MLVLRDYQKEILNLMFNIEEGSYLIQLPTGCGKTIIFTTFINQTDYKVLLLSHREELVYQPIKYIDKQVGIEKGNVTSNGEDIISSCVPSMIKRLDKFPSNYFDVIITDECHHSCSKSYKMIYNYFKPKFHFGFTATPNRADGIRLNDVFQKIIYKANLLDMIKKGYLCDIKCTRSFIDFDLTSVKKSGGDFKLDQLDQAMNDTSKAIAKIAVEKSIGQTLIFGVSVKHCEAIQKELPNSVLVTANTKNRDQIIKDFTNRKFKYLINCMIFTEGTDIPLVETLIIARPTLNESLYIQICGRGLRLYEGKTHLNLIDCVGVSSLPLITAPSLLGLKLKEQKETKKDEFENVSLFDLEDTIEKIEDNINTWKINYKTVNLWAKQMKYNLYNINFYQCVNGDLTLKLPNQKLIRIKHPDELGKSNNGQDFQELIDKCFEWLQENHEKTEYIWDLKIMKRWGSKPATEPQKDLIKKIYGEIPNGLTKLEASQILNRRI